MAFKIIEDFHFMDSRAAENQYKRKVQENIEACW
jgi:hypothetical protein